MPSGKHPSVRTLRARPDLAQLKRQAKELLKAFGAGEIDATAEVHAHYQGAHRETFALHDAQLVLARSFGFASWPKLKAYVDGVTTRRLADAARAGDLATTRSMLAARPELVNLCVGENDEHRALHYAVTERHRDGPSPDAAWRRSAGWNPPHRDATGLCAGRERGYTRSSRSCGKRNPSNLIIAPSGRPRSCVERGDEATMIAALEAQPSLCPRVRRPRQIAALARRDIATPQA
jgi:hypothetical protein